MFSVLLFVIFCFGTVARSSQRSISKDDSYIAAVVEENIPLETKWAEYARIVSEAAQKDSDIILFPEEEVTAIVKIPINGSLLDNPIPALRPDLYDEALVFMSWVARNNSIYIVVNYHELLDCTAEANELCPEAKQYFFNTDVVFDRNGSVILRYRKNNLFAEPKFTPAFEKGVGTFETDFGVTFGVMICFDVLHQVPAMQAVQKGLKNILLNAFWVSQMPFLTAVQAHEAFAYGMDVNLLVAGLSNATDSATGSGMYSGKSGTLISLISGVPTTKLLISKVPKVPGVPRKTIGSLRQDPASLDGLVTISDQSLLSRTTRMLVPGFQEFTLVHNDVTCRFQVVMRQRNGEQRYNYRAAAFSGVSFIEAGDVKLATRDCAVFACMGTSADTCGKRFIPYTENSTAIFEGLFIEGTIPSPIFNPKADAYDSNFYPSTLDVSLLPLEPEDIDYFVEEKEGKSIHSLSLKNTEVELYTFALWGRQYNKDSEDLTPAIVNVDIPQEIMKKESYHKFCGGDNGNSEEIQEDNDEGIVKNLNKFENIVD